MRLERKGDFLQLNQRFIPAKQRRFCRKETPIEQEKGNTFLLSAATQVPIWRDAWQCWEVLKVDDQSLDLEWMDSGRSPLLFNHDASIIIGRNEGCWVEAGILYARSKMKECEHLEDVRQGFLSNVSIGYEILSAYEDENQQGEPMIIIDRARILEISLVSLPADFTAKVEGELPSQQQTKPNTEKEDNMDYSPEDDRRSNIKLIGKQFGLSSWRINNAIADGTSAEELIQEARQMQPKSQPTAVPMDLIGHRSYGDRDRASTTPAPVLGFSERDKNQYSLARALCAMSGLDVEAGFEQEVSRALAQKTGKEAKGLLVPIYDLSWGARSRQQRDALWTGGSASATIATEVGEYVSLLRRKSVLARLGARFLTGLTSNLDLPRLDQGQQARWMGEGALIPESDPSFSPVSFRPRTLGTVTNMTRKALIQASENVELEQILREDLVSAMSEAIESAAIAGQGGNEPVGILNNSDITSGSSLGADGGTITREALIELESIVSDQNSDVGSLHFLTSSKGRGQLRSVKVDAGSGRFLWEDAMRGDYEMAGSGTVIGYPALVSNNVPSNFTKGNGTDLTAVIFGAWDNLTIAEFGVMELLSNPYGAGFYQGLIAIRALGEFDINVRRDVAFAYIKDVTTT